jgi:hypothetical protein
MAHSPESSSRTDMAFSMRWSQRDRPIMMYGFMLLVAVILVLNYFIKFPTLPDEAFAYFQEYREGKLPLQVKTADGVRLERYFANEGISFGIRSLDHPGVTLKGGCVQQFLNHKACTYVYQGFGDRSFVLLRYRGKIDELPAATEIRWDRNLGYYVYLRPRVAAVLWQSQDICSGLVSDASVEEIVGLAQVIRKG